MKFNHRRLFLELLILIPNVNRSNIIWINNVNVTRNVSVNTHAHTHE